ncbi:MAG: CRISPR-associated helicase Cas3' [Blautia sp.]
MIENDNKCHKNRLTRYIAHISEDGSREQLISEHLEGTARLAERFAEEFGYGDWGYCAGKLHDIGKYSLAFQKRIHGGTQKVDHATAGAKVCHERRGYYTALAYCIAGHHAGLPDTGEGADTGSRATYMGRMKKNIENFQAYRDEIEIPELHTPFFQIPRGKDAGFSVGFLTRMLFSCLVDADYLDTEAFMSDGGAVREPGEDMSVLQEKLMAYIDPWMDHEDDQTINGRRTEILKHCIASGEMKKGLFRLTVPTGGGKTIASLAFALNHVIKHGMKRIIYIIPYTSIIEQNAEVFRNILGVENVLEHHSSVDYESDEELKPLQLATENWEKPLVVTTNVQFFESLFSNKTSKCRKLHNIANSVLIFDEAQMLPNDYLKPCVAAMEEMIRYYGSSVVLCTATQPALKALFAPDLIWRELCPRMNEQFQFFKRSQIRKLGILTEAELVSRIREEHQTLCILNTKKEVQKFYEAIAEEGVFHLSTFMYPAHRKRVLQQIRESLASGKRCIVISTSLVEAGVDLDFHTVYRQLAGVDSMIQAAGRCNREGKRMLEESVTYVFGLEQAQKVPGQEQQIDTAEGIIKKYQDISHLDAIEEYFTRLYKFRGDTLDKKGILDQFQKGRFPFAKIGREFRLMEENTKTIFIAKEKRAIELLEEIRRKGMTRRLLRESGTYSVNVYENVFCNIYGAGMLKAVSEDAKDQFFVLRDNENYSEETGLQIDAKFGSGIWF